MSSSSGRSSTPRGPEPSVFMLWALPVGLVAGRLLGGQLDGLADLRFRWAPLALAGLAVQAVLFTAAGDRLAGEFGPAIYVGSTAIVFVAVLANLRLPGLWLAALGAASNLAAIVANGGAMPADPGALALAGFSGPGDHTNSIDIAEPALRPLTDIYAVPAGIPLANVFSVGDVLIAIGVAVAIAATMRSGVGAGSAAGSAPRPGRG